MRRCLVMLMLPHMGSQLRVHDPAESHEPKREKSDYNLLNSAGHKS